MPTTLSTFARPVVLLSRCFHAFAQSIARRHARHAAIMHLHRLEDCTLRDIGIRRGEIEAAVDGRVR